MEKTKRKNLSGGQRNECNKEKDPGENMTVMTKTVVNSPFDSVPEDIPVRDAHAKRDTEYERSDKGQEHKHITYEN